MLIFTHLKQSNMKKLLFILVFGIYSVFGGAQNAVKRYVLLEHFTNSRCSICASKNPAFYSLISGYTADVHHIAYHPPIPYNSCIFYLGNTTENTTRTNFYGVNATPRVALNGTLVNGGSQLLPSATLTTAIGYTSPIHLRVTETSGTNRTATVQIFTHTDVPAGNYNLYVAVVEKDVDYTSPNTGATEHYDVFRSMLPSINGTPVTLAAPGGSITQSFNYSVAAGWNADQIYVVAFLQNADTKEVLNSGTKFDPLTVSSQEPAVLSLSVQPNPVSETATAFIADDRAESLEVFDLSGQRISISLENQQSGAVSFSLAHLPRGIYVVKITGQEKVYTGKVVKE